MAQDYNDILVSGGANIDTLISMLNASLGQVTLTDLQGQNGWQAFNTTLSYASSSSVTLSGDWTARITIGTKIWLTQTTSKWFIVTGTSYSTGNTTLTLNAGNVYTVASAAITSPYYSHAATPYGFPNSFTWTVTHTGFSANPAYTANFNTTGRVCYFSYIPSSGTSNSTNYYFSLPITAATITNIQWNCVGGFCQDNGGRGVDPFIFIQSGATSAIIQLTGGYSTFQASGTKYCQVCGYYLF